MRIERISFKFSYASIAFSTSLTTYTLILFFSSTYFLESLSIGEINHNQIKKQIIRNRSTIKLINPINIVKLNLLNEIANKEKK